MIILQTVVFPDAVPPATPEKKKSIIIVTKAITREANGKQMTIIVKFSPMTNGCFVGIVVDSEEADWRDKSSAKSSANSITVSIFYKKWVIIIIIFFPKL